MNIIIEKLTGVDVVTDQNIANDLLIDTKTGIKSYAIALTEATSPRSRTILQNHLNDTIAFHEKVTNYMMEKGWYHPYDIKAQIDAGMKSAHKALNLPD